MSSVWVGIAAGGLLALAACSAPAPSPESAAKPATAVIPLTPPSDAKVAAETHAPLAPSHVGVAECDAYLTHYRVCIDSKMPAAEQADQRDAYLKGVAALQEAIKATGNTARLAESCNMAAAAAKAAFKKFGCDDF